VVSIEGREGIVLTNLYSGLTQSYLQSHWRLGGIFDL